MQHSQAGDGVSRQGPRFFPHFANGGQRTTKQEDARKKNLGDDLPVLRPNRRDRRNAGRRGMFIQSQVAHRTKSPDYRPRMSHWLKDQERQSQNAVKSD